MICTMFMACCCLVKQLTFGEDVADVLADILLGG